MHFIRWILKLFHLAYVTEEEYENLKICHQKTVDHMETLQLHNNELEEYIATVEFKTLSDYEQHQKELEIQQDKLNHDLIEAEEYYKKVQKDLSKALHDDPVFGFKNNMAFPGSTSVCGQILQDSDKNPHIVISGRTIFPDDVTAEIQNTADLSMKYQIALNHLLRYGVIDQIAKQMIYNGALQFTLAYNSDCTCLELYYQVACKKPETAIKVDVDLTKK